MLIAGFCGSTSEVSSNRWVLDLAADVIRSRGDRFSMCAGVDEIPVFRPESVDDAPPQVLALRAEFEAADGVIVAIPEYGGGAAGWAKNALDWMIGSGSLYQRPVVVVCAGTTGGPNAIEQIARTLTWQGASVVATLGIAAPLTKIDTSGALTDVDTIAALDQVVSLLLIATRAGDAELAEFAAAAVTPLGIHPTDRTGR